MKLCLGSTPVKSLNIRKLDVDTNDATIVASDMQSGSIAYAKGQKVTGTGKAFAFASYGKQPTNFAIPIPGMINVIEIGCISHAFQTNVDVNQMKDLDFSIEQELGNIVIDGVNCPITSLVENNTLTLNCSQSVELLVFYGKDDHV